MRTGRRPPREGREDAGEAALVYGIHPMEALLAEGGRRVESLLIQQHSRNPRLEGLALLARERGVRVRFVPPEELDRLTGFQVHQGVAARVAPRPALSFDALLERIAATPDALLLLLDGVEDPRNLGAVLRSAAAAGVLAVVAGKDRAAPLSAVAVKSSAGAAEMVDLVRVTNLARAMEELKEAGLFLWGLAADGEATLWSADLGGPVGLVLGGEGKGLRRLTREKCDGILSIPMAAGAVSSLNASVAAAVALFEVRRRRSS